jgi:hypothetical protein
MRTLSIVRIGKLALRLLARKQQVHQIVIAQIEQVGQRAHVGVAEVTLIFAEEALEEKIVFEQAASCAPAKARTAQRVGLV